MNIQINVKNGTFIVENFFGPVEQASVVIAAMLTQYPNATIEVFKG